MAQELPPTSPRLVLLPPEACIISRLCADLTTLSRASLARSAVILPTRRLVTFCLAALAQRYPAYEPPLMTTLDGLLARLCTTESPVINELHAEQLVHILLSQGKYRYLQPAFAHEIKQLFNELSAADLQAHCHHRITQQLAHNPWLAEGEIEQQRQKYHELQQLFTALQAQLQTDGHATPALARTTALPIALAALDAANFAQVYIAAFTSVTKTACTFLQKIAALPHTTLYFNTATIDSHINPVTELITALTPAASVPPPSPTQGRNPTSAAASVSILHFASPQIEVTHALRQAERLLQAEDVRPAEIAIILSRDAFYLPHLLAVADFFTFAKNIAVPIPLRMTSVGSFLQALSNYACDEFKVPAAIDLVAHPLGPASDLPDDSIITALSTIHRPGKLRLPAGTPEAAAAIASIDALVQRFPRASLRLQLSALQELLHELRFFKLAAQDNYELQSIENVFTFLQNLAASSLSAVKFSPQEFWQFVADKFLTLPLHQVGEPLAGVQILSLPEVRAMPFQHVLVLGCNEGFFPKALPDDVIVNDKLKTAIGLNGWQHLEAMEEITFQALLHRRGQLTLSYCSSSTTGERSRFIEKIIRTHELAEQDCRGLALQELLPMSAVAVEAQGSAPVFAPRHFFSSVSASSAESFIRCPLRHVLDKLDIANSVCAVRDRHSPREEGNQLHKVIEMFSGSPDYQHICRTVKNHAARVAQLCELLNNITATQASSLLNDSALAAHLRLFAWPRLAEFVSQKNSGADYQELHEHELNLSGELRWFGGQHCELSGKIDHIHADQDHLLLLDYKRKSLPDNKELDAAIAAQLAFYADALACERRAAGASHGLATMVTGYYSILNGEFTLVAHGTDISANFLRERYHCTKRNTRTLETLVAKMHDLLVFRSAHPDIYETADPSYCGGCQFDNLCRKNDPALQARIARQNYLQEYLHSAAPTRNNAR